MCGAVKKENGNNWLLHCNRPGRLLKNKGQAAEAAEGGLMYNPKSTKATEFIDHQEILDSLEYARANKNNTQLIEELIERARDCKGLSHREAALLLECDDPALWKKCTTWQKKSNRNFMETELSCLRLFIFSNYCVNGCVYCPYHAKNKHIRRKKLTQEEIRQEVIALQDMGHKRLALETGEDPKTILLNMCWKVSKPFTV